MQTVNIDRINEKKIKFGEVPIKLIKNTYKNVRVKDGYLVDSKGKKTGTKGDMILKTILDKIFQEGCLDHDPRPVYIDKYKNAKYYKRDHLIITSDGKEVEVDKNAVVIERENEIEVRSKAHTLSVNNVGDVIIDLSKGESAMTTLRLIAYLTAVAEILWIYQLESNDLVEFDELIGNNTWDVDHIIHNWWEQWALKDSKGNYILNEKNHPIIGHCYGGTTKKWNMLYHYVIDSIRKNPDGRRNITCTWQYDDFEKPHGLKPCAFLTEWNVRHGWDGVDYLDMKLTQRSSDFATAGIINMIQYIALQLMVARELGLTPGTFTWSPTNVQIYDRHIVQCIELLNRDPIDAKCEMKIKESAKKFKTMKKDDIYFEDYPKELIKKKNPQLKYQLGV